MNTKKLLRILSYPLAVLLTVAVTLSAVTVYLRSQQQEGENKLSVLSQLIQDRFIGEVDSVAIEDAAADAMIAALGDRWSYYIPAEEYAAYADQKTNSYVGIGVTITTRQDGAGQDVTQVTKGGSAEEAGILAGDIIVGVDGQSIAGMDVNAIRDLIRGEVGTTVDITVRREGKDLVLTVTRKQIKTPVATAQLLDDDVGLITIANFNDNCTEETVAAIESLKEQGAQKLIFDVRNNPGGYAHELVDVLDYLLPEGPLFRTVDYAGNEQVEESDAAFLDMPMAVLVNGESYSAAEFFAAALAEYEAAVVVGEQTCGKGYFQTTYLLPDGSAVGLSIGKYFTPKGVSLAETGITPEVLVPVDPETFAAIYAGTLDPQEDPQIQAAIKALNET